MESRDRPRAERERVRFRICGNFTIELADTMPRPSAFEVASFRHTLEERSRSWTRVRKQAGPRREVARSSIGPGGYE